MSFGKKRVGADTGGLIRNNGDISCLPSGRREQKGSGNPAKNLIFLFMVLPLLLGWADKEINKPISIAIKIS